MNNKIIVVITIVIAIMVSIIAFIQLLPFMEQYQRDLEEKESFKNPIKSKKVLILLS